VIRASPIETHGHRPAFAYRVGTADQQGANMFQRLQALLIGAIIAFTLTGAGGASAQAVFEYSPNGYGVTINDGGYLARVSVTVPTTISAIAQQSNATSSVNVKFIVRNQTNGTNLYVSQPKVFGADASGVYTFKQSDVFSNITLQPGVVYSIGIISEGLQSVRYLTGPVPAQNDITMTGTVFVSSYAAPMVVGSGSEKFSLRLIGPAAPAPAPIPTLSEWALILLGVLLAGGAALTLHRRRTA
jgi:hypothetical protein